MSDKMPKLTFQLNADDFLPATEEEKESLIVMRQSVGFWKDSMRRLRKNKVAMVSLVFIILIMFISFILPNFYPYSYEQHDGCSHEADGERNPAAHHNSDRIITSKLVRTKNVWKYLFPSSNFLLFSNGISHRAEILCPLLLLLVGIWVELWKHK